MQRVTLEAGSISGNKGPMWALMGPYSRKAGGLGPYPTHFFPHMYLLPRLAETTTLTVGFGPSDTHLTPIKSGPSVAHLVTNNKMPKRVDGFK